MHKNIRERIRKKKTHGPCIVSLFFFLDIKHAYFPKLLIILPILKQLKTRSTSAGIRGSEERNFLTLAQEDERF